VINAVRTHRTILLLAALAAFLGTTVLARAAAAQGANGAQGDRTDLTRLSSQQLAGQRAIYSYPGLQPPARLLELIRNGRVGGVIFFGANISSKA